MIRRLLHNTMGRLVDRSMVSGLSTQIPVVSSGSPFSLTIPVAGFFTLTAAGDATGMTAEAWGAGDGVTKGDYAKTLNQSLLSGETYSVNNGDYNAYSQVYKNATPIVVAAGSANATSIGDSTIAHGGNLNDGQVKLAGTTAASGFAFTCPNLIVSVTNNGSGKCRVATMGAHGLSAAQGINISGTGVVSYDAPHTVTATPTASTFDTGVDYVSDVTGTVCGAWSSAG